MLNSRTTVWWGRFGHPPNFFSRFRIASVKLRLAKLGSLCRNGGMNGEQIITMRRIRGILVARPISFQKPPEKFYKLPVKPTPKRYLDCVATDYCKVSTQTTNPNAEEIRRLNKQLQDIAYGRAKGTNACDAVPDIRQRIKELGGNPVHIHPH